jgi:uncharacterized protein (DUF342 family)
MKKKIIHILIFLLFLPGISLAEDIELTELLDQIDQVENTLSKENQEFKEKLAQQEKRLSKFSSDIATVQAAKEDIEEKYKEILKKEALFDSVKKEITDNRLALAETKTRLDELKNDQVRIEGNIDSSQKIVTWVTLIVSVVVVLIGAFFSKIFLELYSNYKVICARYPEVKPPDKDNDA